jgi:hypothetical protein
MVIRPAFEATIHHDLPPETQALVNVYDAAPGASGPYCNPSSLAAVLDMLSRQGEFGEYGRQMFRDYAKMLRGDQV